MATTSARSFRFGRGARLWKRLLAVAGRRRGAGRRYYPAGPETAAASYFVTRTSRRPSRDDFLALGCTSPEQLSERLAERWGEEQAGELADLASDFGRLSAQLQRSAAPQDEEVSQFVYVMY